MNELPRLTDDGLITPEVGGWAVDKYRHVRNYAEMFVTAMKAKWESRADLAPENSQPRWT